MQFLITWQGDHLKEAKIILDEYFLIGEKIEFGRIIPHQKLLFETVWNQRKK